MNPAIIIGSSRDMGNTHKLSLTISEMLSAPIFNLNDYHMSPYDYNHKNRDDDFLPLIKKLLSFDTIVLASPMYWYSPSSQMKIFLDRISDLLSIEKYLGRQLKTKNGALIATGCDAIPPSCFEEAFKLSYKYLSMNYKGMIYCSCDDEIDLDQNYPAINEFIGKLYAK